LRPRRAVELLLIAGVVAAASLSPCEETLEESVDAGNGVAYQPDRRDYATFRAAFPNLLEPNYLPFMLHRFPGHSPAGDLLVVCRWSEEAMPLPVYIQAPVISESLQDEFDPVAPQVYVRRVGRALEIWEEALEGLVRFRRVDQPAKALLTLRILGEVAPTPLEEIQVLGTTGALLGACRSRGWDSDAERLRVEFRVPELRIYVADRSGLLTPNQVEGVALHEIGHALGMLGHSPIESDWMYRVVRDQPRVARLSTADVNSFLNLYTLPNGTVYARVAPDGPAPRPPPAPPSGAPVLALAPHVDARHGFEIRPPMGWSRVETQHGFFSANGPVWDRDASFEIVIWPHPTIEGFLRRFGPELFAGTWRRARVPMVVNGRRALRIAVEDAEGRLDEQFTFVELGDGRILMILTQCPVEFRNQWAPWFQASLASLEIWSEPGASSAP
jgi:hypothetical protein